MKLWNTFQLEENNTTEYLFGIQFLFSVLGQKKLKLGVSFNNSDFYITQAVFSKIVFFYIYN